MGSLSALDDPAAAGAPVVGSFRRFSPATTTGKPRHGGSRRILLTLCSSMTVRLPSCPVSLWVVYLASREPARACRPSDLFSSRHHQAGRSVEKFLPTPGLLSPQTPTLPPFSQLGFPVRGIACIWSIISVHAALAWPRSPCAWPSTPATLPLNQLNTYSMYLPAATNLTASTACNLQEYLVEPPGSI